MDYFRIILLVLLFNLNLLAGEDKQYNEDTIFKFIVKGSIIDNEPSGDYIYLIKSTASLFGFSIIAAGGLYIMPETITKWDKSTMSLNSLAKKWQDNVSRPPVWDKDSWFMNYAIHPYCGSFYYLQSRRAGYGYLKSFIYSTLISTFFWEYGVEAFAERPSIQDLIITPVVGSILGESLYGLSEYIESNENKILGSQVLGSVTLFIIDPIHFFSKNSTTRMKIQPVSKNSVLINLSINL